MDAWSEVFYDRLKHHFKNSLMGLPQGLVIQMPKNDRTLYPWLNGLSEEFPDTKVFQLTLSHEHSQTPFYPLLDLVKDTWAGNSPELNQRVLRKIFGFHQDLFWNFFEKGVLKREQEPLMVTSEILWEQEEMSHSIIELLALLGRGPLILVFEDIHLASPSLFRFLNTLITKKKGYKILLLCLSDPMGRDPDEVLSPFWLGFNQFMEETGRVLDQSFPYKKKLTLEEPHTAPAPIPREPKLILTNAQEALEFFAFDEAKNLLAQVQKQNSQGSSSWGPEQDFQFQSAQGDLYFMTGEADLSLSFYNQMLNLGQTENHPPWIAIAFYKIGLVFSRKNDTESALKFLRQSLKLAQELGDQGFKARVMVHIVILTDGMETTFENLKNYRETLELLESLKMENFLSALLSRGPYMLSLYRKVSPQAAMETCAKAINISKKNHHQYRLSVAYHCQGLIYQLAHNKDLALSFFKKSIRIRRSLGDSLELIKIYNGTGYYCFVEEDYPTALAYFEKSLVLLEDSRDFDEISLTLFNLAMVEFFTLDYDGAWRDLEKMIVLMNELEIREQPFHGQFEIYTYLGFASLRSGRPTKSLEVLRKTQGILEGRTPDIFPLYQLWEAILLLEGGEISKGLKLAYGSLDLARSSGHWTNYLHHCWELYQSLKILDRLGEGQEVLKQGLSLTSESPHPFYSGLFRHELGESVNIKKPRPRTVTFNVKAFMEAARQAINLNRLHKKVGEIYFLNNLQNVAFQHEELPVFLNHSLELVKNSFLAESVQLFEEDPVTGKVQVVWPEGPAESKKPFQILYHSLTAMGGEILLVQPDPRLPLNFQSLIFLPLNSAAGVRGALVLGTLHDHYQFTTDDLRILSMGAKLITMARDLKEATKQLMEAATTDTLTGLLNRREFHRRLDEEWKRQVRNRKMGLDPMGVLFIDLDNFKYYNDTFGHPAGDLILRCFSDVLRSCLREVDLAARFGGDEFVIFLPETKPEGVEVVAQRIYKTLATRGHFLPELTNELGTEVQISSHLLINCSIGINVKEGKNVESLDAFLAQADQALYQAKRKGKGRWVVA